MPPDARRNDQKHAQILFNNLVCKTIVSPRMSTMGKSTEPLSERMKLRGMCEEIDVETLSEMRQTGDGEEEQIITINLFDAFEDVDAIKSRVQNVGATSSEVEVDTSCDIKGNGTLMDRQKSCDKESETDHSISSSETILCGEGGTDGENDCNLGVGERQVCDTDITLISARDDTRVETSVNGYSPSNQYNGKSASGIKSGLLMSPITLTQDMPVAIGNSSNRLSLVLENMPLPLLYIPTTKQLVAGQNSADGSNSLPFQNSEHGTYEDMGKNSAEFPSIQDSVCNGSEATSPKEVRTPNGSEASQNDCSIGELDTRSSQDLDRVTLNSVDCLIPHNTTSDSVTKLYTDVSSLSSISTSTDFSISAASLGEEYSESKSLSLETEDTGFMDVNLHSRNSYERTRNMSHDSGIEDKGAKPKRKGLTNFLSRNIFSRKPKENVDSLPGWKLFGRIPPKAGTQKDSSQISNEYQAKQRVPVSVGNRTKKQDVEVLSTTALILENRPLNLPSKSPEEAEKHRQEYESMVEAARKKEQKELKQKKKQLQQQLRQEDQLVAAARIWNTEILPNWDVTRNSKKARDLWWYGLPPNVRGKVWKLAIGNELNITQELYEICGSRAVDRINMTQESSDATGTGETPSEPPSNKEDSVNVIKLDVSRTFPQLCIFQKGGPYHDLLHGLLGAYACYRPDVGYVQGMSFISAVLLLNMDVDDAFICFANLLNRPCQVTFFRMDEEMMKAYYDTFEDFFKENMPTLYDHFRNHNLTPNLYLIDWIFLLYSKSLPLDVACRVWDVLCRDGEEFLFRTALGILKMYEAVLLNMDFIHLAQFLTKLPEDISGDVLFRNIETIRMNIDKKRFAQILSIHKEARESLS